MNKNTNEFTDFLSLGIDEKFIQKLNKLNITVPTEIQQKAIPLILKKSNLMFESETGTGKTLAYLLPLVQNLENNLLPEDKIIILSPTYELSSQIKTTANLITELKSSLFIGGTPIKRQIEALKEKPHIITGNPSRILELVHLKKLKTQNIKALVLDEADRLISSEIIEETRKLIQLLPCDIQFVACSATLSISAKRILSGFRANIQEII